MKYSHFCPLTESQEQLDNLNFKTPQGIGITEATTQDRFTFRPQIYQSPICTQLQS